MSKPQEILFVVKTSKHFILVDYFFDEFRTIDGLIGQANLAYAKNHVEDAMNFLKEAIREDPRHPDAYTQIANIFVDQNQTALGFEYRLMGAHLDSKTVAAEWAEIGETAVKLERIEEATACYGNGLCFSLISTQFDF